MLVPNSIRTLPLNYKQSYYSSIPEFLLVISVFTKEIGTYSFQGVDFDFIGYPFFLIYFLYNLRELILGSCVPWKLFLYLIGSSIFSILYLNLEWGGFIKQILPIIIIFSVCFSIIRKYDWRLVFQLYVKFAMFSAIFGIIQYFLSIIGINLLIKTPGRVDSISYEPSHYASILIPALVYSFFFLKTYRRYFFVMLLALILTFNLTGYLVFLLIISIAYINPIYLIIALPFFYFIVFGIFKDLNENFNKRIVDTLAVFKGNINVLNSTLDANGTTVSLYSNLMVAKENISNSFITGSGLGGHEETYFRFYKNSSFRLNYLYGMNAKSAHSLTIRILSELGIIGFILYIVALVRNVFLLDNGVFRAISLACLSHFLCKTFKLGGIIDYGTPFFFAMIIINGINYRYNKSLYGAK